MAARIPCNAPWIALLVGALLVALALIGWTVSSGARLAEAAREVEIDVDMPSRPKVPDAPTPRPLGGAQSAPGAAPGVPPA